jgi:hypothetical protein
MTSVTGLTFVAVLRFTVGRSVMKRMIIVRALTVLLLGCLASAQTFSIRGIRAGMPITEANSTLRAQGFKMETPASDECLASGGGLVCPYFKLSKGQSLTGDYQEDFNSEGTIEAFWLVFDITSHRLAEVTYVSRSTRFDELRRTLTSKYGKAVLDDGTATWKRTGEVLELTEPQDTPGGKVEFHNICLANHVDSIAIGRGNLATFTQGRSCPCCVASR